jgi:hypothetical protein
MTMDKPVKLTFQATIRRKAAAGELFAATPPTTVTVIGRVGWAILSLIQAGSKGCTPISRPAPRWSDYIFKARALGFDVETITEGHDGTFAGHHAKYVLRDDVAVFGGTLDEYLASPEGRREFGVSGFTRRAA